MRSCSTILNLLAKVGITNQHHRFKMLLLTLFGILKRFLEFLFCFVCRGWLVVLAGFFHRDVHVCVASWSRYQARVDLVRPAACVLLWGTCCSWRFVWESWSFLTTWLFCFIFLSIIFINFRLATWCLSINFNSGVARYDAHLWTRCKLSDRASANGLIVLPITSHFTSNLAMLCLLPNLVRIVTWLLLAVFLKHERV